MDARLPRLLIIADGFTDECHRRRVLDLAEADALPWVQLRDHYARPDQFRVKGRQLIAEIREASPSTVISVNGNHELAEECRVGLHLGFRSISPVDAKKRFGQDMLIGYSAHADSHLSVTRHCDYITFSPVFPVKKAPDTPSLGMEKLGGMARKSPKPVFALGAITPERVADCLRVGAYGVAVLSGVMAQQSAVDAARAYLDAIKAAVTTEAGRPE